MSNLQDELDKLFLSYLKKKLLTDWRCPVRFKLSVISQTFSRITWSFPMQKAIEIALQNNAQQEFLITEFGVFGEPETELGAITVITSQPNLIDIVQSPDNKKFALVGKGVDGVANVTLDDGLGATGSMIITLADPHVVALGAEISGDPQIAGSPFSWDTPAEIPAPEAPFPPTGSGDVSSLKSATTT